MHTTQSLPLPKATRYWSVFCNYKTRSRQSFSGWPEVQRYLAPYIQQRHSYLCLSLPRKSLRSGSSYGICPTFLPSEYAIHTHPPSPRFLTRQVSLLYPTSMSDSLRRCRKPSLLALQILSSPSLMRTLPSSPLPRMTTPTEVSTATFSTFFFPYSFLLLF